MNANELADLLDECMEDGSTDLVCVEQAATMLRQQQAEIEALKLQLHTTLTNRDLRTYDGKLSMNKEPVAWLIQAKTWHEFTFSKPAEDSEDVVIEPLYTHPAKTLTDEVLMQLYEVADYSPESYLEEARAILKKASEK